VTVANVGVIVDELRVALPPVDRNVCRGPDDGSRNTIRRGIERGAKTNSRDIVTVGDVLQCRAVAEPEAEFAGLAWAEDVSYGQAGIVLAVVVDAEIIA
jgi:hypothetical protein